MIFTRWDEGPQQKDFFDYWDSLGFFDSFQNFLPPQFFVLFQIARIIFSEEITTEAYEAIETISKDEPIFKPDRNESIQVNRMEKIAPVSDRMEIDTFRTIQELKKALPRELAQDDDVFSARLFTKTLMVQKFYESEADSFKPISTSRDKKGKDANRFEQKFYILLDRSKSMEMKMRSFYSKCLVAEFLRRKMQSKARLYYRPFDTKPGKLSRIEKKEDFPGLIERILFTTTGGTSTNIQGAVFQAISDIRYDKEMAKSEILVVTDGISKIDRDEMRVKLGDIKLSVLKVGKDVAEPDFYDIEAYFKREGIPYDPNTMDIRNVQRKLARAESGDEEVTLTTTEKRALRFISDASEKMFKDLRDIANNYIEIEDLDCSNLYEVDEETLAYIKATVMGFDMVDLSELEIPDKEKLYKHVNFMSQYVQMLMDNGNEENQVLRFVTEKLSQIKQKMLKDPYLLFTFLQVKELNEDRKMMKLAKKEARQALKNMKLENRKLSVKEMREGQLLLTMDVGEGSMGQFFRFLLVKLFDLLKAAFTAPAKLFQKKEKPSDDEGDDDRLNGDRISA